MKGIEEITDGPQILARVIRHDGLWQKGLNFFSKDKESIQVGTWGYEANKKLQAHSHNEVVREIPRTQEVIFVKQGKLKANIFGKEDNFVAEVQLHGGDLIIMLEGGHSYEIIDDNTQVLEIKNGPYVGAENDRRRF